MVSRFVIGALLALVLATGGSAAGAKAVATWSVYVGVVSVNSNVTLSPTGELVDPDCPNTVCRFRYPSGTAVTLTAVTGAGSSFAGWHALYTNIPAACGGTSPVCTVVMDGTKAVKAGFSPVQLWPRSNRGGHIEATAGGSCGSGCIQYRYGQVITVEAVADRGYHFDSWTSTRCRTIRGEGCRFTMTDHMYISAYFVSNDGTASGSYPVTLYVPFRVSLRGTGTGSVTGPLKLSCPSRCEADYERNRQVALTATATGGSRFIGWDSTGACANARGATCVFRAIPNSSGSGRSTTAWFNRP